MEHDLKTKYKNDYLIYARKSTDDKDSQKNSISYQRMEGVRFCKNAHLPVAPLTIEGFCNEGIISERHTGFKQDEYFHIRKDGTIEFRIERPKFARLVHYLQQGNFKGIIFLCWDRASRNENDDNIIKKLLKKGVDIKFVQTEYENSSSGALHMDIDGTFSRHHSRVASEKISNTIRKLRDEGVCTYRAPIGYLNTGDIRSKPFDPVRAPLVKQLFEKYADGTWSLIDLAKWANEQGLTMPATRRKRTEQEKLMDDDVAIEPIERPITFQHIHFILHNQFYLGLTIGNDKKMVRSVSHEPLVTKELFDSVQEILKSKQVSIHYVQKPDFPYRGLVHCNQCRRVYTPYEQKGIHYYGSRCISTCGNDKRNINTGFIEREAGEVLSQIYMTSQKFTEIDANIKNDLALWEEQRDKAVIEHEQQERKLREDKSYLANNKLMLIKSGLYTPEQYLAEEQKIENQIQSVNEKLQNRVTLPEFLRTLKKHSELIKTLYYHYEIANPLEKSRLLRNVFSELKVSENRLVYKCKKAFEVLELPFVVLGEPSTWISELMDKNDSFQKCVYNLEILLSQK